MLKLTFLISTIIIGSSCSVVKRTAISSTATIMKEGSLQLNHEGNWQLFKESAPANLKMLEGLWFADQNNQNLLTLLIKGYAGHAYAVNETLALDDQLAEIENSYHKKQAIMNYTKAYDYGIFYLKSKNISETDLMDRKALDELPKKLKNKLDRQDMLAVFYFAQAWGGLINLQRTNVALLANMGSVKALMDWVCQLDPEFEFGSCQLFYAVYEAGRPAMLGGDLEKGREIFEKYILHNSLNLLARVSFIQYYIIPTLDSTLYAQQAEFLKREFMLWDESLNLGARTSENLKYVKASQFNLFNAMAKKRFEIIEKYRKDIF